MSEDERDIDVELDDGDLGGMDDEGGSELIHARLIVSRGTIWRFSLLSLVVLSQS